MIVGKVMLMVAGDSFMTCCLVETIINIARTIIVNWINELSSDVHD